MSEAEEEEYDVPGADLNPSVEIDLPTGGLFEYSIRPCGAVDCPPRVCMIPELRVANECEHSDRKVDDDKCKRQCEEANKTRAIDIRVGRGHDDRELSSIPPQSKGGDTTIYDGDQADQSRPNEDEGDTRPAVIERRRAASNREYVIAIRLDDEMCHHEIEGNACTEATFECNTPMSFGLGSC